MTPGMRGLADPVRSKTEAALDLAVAALERFARGQSELEVVGHLYAKQALARIAVLREGGE